MPMLKADPARGHTSSPPSVTVSDCTALKGVGLLPAPHTSSILDPELKLVLICISWQVLSITCSMQAVVQAWILMPSPDQLPMLYTDVQAAPQASCLERSERIHVFVIKEFEGQRTRWSDDMRMWASGNCSMKGSGSLSLPHAANWLPSAPGQSSWCPRDMAVHSRGDAATTLGLLSNMQLQLVAYCCFGTFKVEWAAAGGCVLLHRFTHTAASTQSAGASTRPCRHRRQGC